MAVPFDEPRAMVPICELEQGEAELLDGVERPDPQELLLARGSGTGAERNSPLTPALV
jgi:hypothetical protein